MANYTQRREAWITAALEAGIDVGFHFLYL